MSSLVYKEFKEIDRLTNHIASLFEGACYAHIPKYLNGEDLILETESEECIEDFRNGSKWDSLDAIEEIKLNLIEHSDEVCKKYLFYLRDELYWGLKSFKERCDFETWQDNLDLAQGVLNGTIEPPVDFSISVILREQSTFRNFFTFVHTFAYNVQALIDFVEIQLIRINDPIGKNTHNTFEPIRLKQPRIKNQIPTFFYNLLKEGKVANTATELQRLLIEIVRDEDGNELSPETLKDIFTPSKHESRSKKV